eukprot:gene25119-31536_t
MSGPEANAAGGYWGWLGAAQQQAKEFAEKAHEFAEIASKATHEQAAYLAKQASELRQNYDMEVATSILMSTVGGPVDSTFNPPTHATKMNFKDLDMVYITENILAMAFPFDRSKPGNKDNGNDINVIATYLQKKHQDHFMIWNISEESYDYSRFADQVLEYKFPGHPAPPLGLLFKICTSVESWLDADESNIAVIHCLTGKGRTAALMACILAWIGEFSSPMEALQYIADRRGISVDHLTIPSQRRYVQYFSNMLDGVKPRSEPLLLRRVIINSIPIFGVNSAAKDATAADIAATQGCSPYLQLFKNGRLIATATPTVETSGAENSEDSASGGNKMELKWINATEGSVSFSMDVAIQGDILLRCRHAAASGVRVSMFRAGFHTGYVPSGVLRLTKAQLDGSSADPRYADDFFIDLIFAPIVKATSSTVNATSTSNLTADSPVVSASVSASAVTDSGLTIDATSTDNGDDAKLYTTDENEVEVNFNNITSSTSNTANTTSNKSSGISGLSDMELIMQLAQLEGDDDDTVVFNSSTNNNNNNNNEESSSASGSISDQGVDCDDFTLIGVVSRDKTTTTPSSATNSAKQTPSTTTSVANMELQALEELERELGLGDMNLFSGGSAEGSLKTPLKEGAAGSIKPTSSFKSTPAPAASHSQQEDDDNLDELEQYLQSLSAPSSAAK